MKKFRLLSLFLALCFLLSGCLLPAEPSESPASSPADPNYIVSPEAAPDYSGVPYVAIRGNVPDFTEGRNLPAGYEYYAPLDLLGRCGVTEALVGPETLPTEERGNIGQVKPSGWVMAKYDFVDGKYLYNRCHLIGYQLTGENANTSNLITGTRYMNVDGMLPFENMVADYVRETGNHVRYRVTPIFRGRELVARGVQMEAMSVEDGGDAVCFNVYVYNVQPGVTIDYSTGNSTLAPTPTPASGSLSSMHYVLNTSSKKFHLPTCSGASAIKEENRGLFQGTRSELIAMGYSPCGAWKP